MKYMLLIYGDEQTLAMRPEAERSSMMEEYHVFTKDLISAKSFVGASSLKATTTGTTVRVRNGKTTMTDGPFAETKEQLGGYYIVDCATLNEAIACASKIPCVRTAHSSCEVRPLGIITGSDGGIAVTQ